MTCAMNAILDSLKVVKSNVDLAQLVADKDTTLYSALTQHLGYDLGIETYNAVIEAKLGLLVPDNSVYTMKLSFDEEYGKLCRELRAEIFVGTSIDKVGMVRDIGGNCVRGLTRTLYDLSNNIDKYKDYPVFSIREKNSTSICINYNSSDTSNTKLAKIQCEESLMRYIVSELSNELLIRAFFSQLTNNKYTDASAEIMDKLHDIYNHARTKDLSSFPFCMFTAMSKNACYGLIASDKAAYTVKQPEINKYKREDILTFITLFVKELAHKLNLDEKLVLDSFQFYSICMSENNSNYVPATFFINSNNSYSKTFDIEKEETVQEDVVEAEQCETEETQFKVEEPPLKVQVEEDRVITDETQFQDERSRFYTNLGNLKFNEEVTDDIKDIFKSKIDGFYLDCNSSDYSQRGIAENEVMEVEKATAHPRIVPTYCSNGFDLRYYHELFELVQSCVEGRDRIIVHSVVVKSGSRYWHMKPSLRGCTSRSSYTLSIDDIMYTIAQCLIDEGYSFKDICKEVNRGKLKPLDDYCLDSGLTEYEKLDLWYNYKYNSSSTTLLMYLKVMFDKFGFSSEDIKCDF